MDGIDIDGIIDGNNDGDSQEVQGQESLPEILKVGPLESPDPHGPHGLPKFPYTPEKNYHHNGDDADNFVESLMKRGLSQDRSLALCLISEYNRGVNTNPILSHFLWFDWVQVHICRF